MNQSSDCFEVLCQRRSETQSSCWAPGTRWPWPGCPGRLQPWPPGTDLSSCELCVPSQGLCSSVLGSLLCVSDKLVMVSRSKVFSARRVLCTTHSFTGLVAAPLSLRCLRLHSLPPSLLSDLLHWPPHANYVTFKLFAFQPGGAGLSLSLGLYTSSSVSAGTIAKLGPRQSRSFLITAVSPLFITDIADSINACV